MKNLVKIKETLYCSVRHYGKALLLLVALTALSGSAWADENSWIRKSALVLYTGGSNDNTYILNSTDGDGCNGFTSTTNFSGYKFGTLTSFRFKQCIGDGWTKSGYWIAENSFTCYYRIYRKGSGAPGWTSIAVNSWVCEHNTNGYKSYRSNNDIDLLSGLSAGDYYFEVVLKMSEYREGGSYDRMIPGNGGYSSSASGYNSEFTVPGFKSLSPSSLSDFGNIIVNRESTGKTVTCTFYGSNNGLKSGNSSKTDFTVSISGNVATIKFTPKSTGKITATITLTDKYGKTATISVSGTGLEQKTPTVYIGAKEVVDNTDVTLSGYVKYTGCYPITEYGFLVGTDESAVEAGTGTKYQSTTTGTIAAGSDFTLTQQFADNLYYYRAWIKANGTDYYSSETRSFQIIGGCPYPTPKPTLTMDGNVNNLVCLNETSTAECRSAIGYKYYLYKDDAPAVDEHGTPFAERPGTGATFKWTGNFGAGTFTVRTKPNDQECMAVIATATQAVNEPTLAITASKNEATAFEPVTISMDDGQTGLTKPIWATTGGYLLDSGTGLIYSGKEISEVTLKAGVDAITEVTVTATSYKTGEYEGVTKTCPATATKVITVSPAEEVCPKP